MEVTRSGRSENATAARRPSVAAAHNFKGQGYRVRLGSCCLLMLGKLLGAARRPSVVAGHNFDDQGCRYGSTRWRLRLRGIVPY